MSKKPITSQKIGFIGGGNMGTAIMGGLITKDANPEYIWVTDHNSDKLQMLEQQYGINPASNIAELYQAVDTIVIAIKPHDVKPLLSQLSEQPDVTHKCFISVAAGITTEQMCRWLGQNCQVIRAMPNTPSLIGFGMTGLFAQHCQETSKHMATELFESVGSTLWLEDESLMDTVTAVSGSGPAYFFYFIELMMSSAEKLGLNPEQAKKLSLQTALGAVNMAIKSEDSVSELRKKVTSKGGTTEAGLNSLKSANLASIIHKALIAAQEKGKILSKQND